MFHSVQDLASGVPELFRHGIQQHKDANEGRLPALLVAHPDVVTMLKLDAPESIYPDFTGAGVEFDSIPVLELAECQYPEMLTWKGEREYL